MKKPQLTREDFENVDDIGLTEFIKRYKSNPIKFAEEVCQLTLDEPQKQILLSLPRTVRQTVSVIRLLIPAALTTLPA